MKPPIKAIIVDDELYSRDELKHLLQAFPTIEIIGEAESGESAIMKSLQLHPDVVFLDVEMPRMNGMEAAKVLMELKNAPLVVFATAYPQFAAEAFRYDAVDYLLKPYDEDQLKETIERIEKKFKGYYEKDPGKPTGKLAFEANGEILYFDPKDILYMFRDDKLTKMIVKTGEFETKTPLKELESKLSTFHFFRIHKSYLVNLEYITRLTPWFNGAYQLQIEGRDEMLSVSRNYVKALRMRLEI
ncbi:MULTISPECIES: LytR/AlgR family response regulator transcription factor [Metabacillus]|uniref:LytTR family DNA-binding domain-containing protein n=1 Tax=Metabacillus rhizolycopersici TaxID=2875709 RepID=A0ABS7V0J0_9BACI|nr:MULTISPECIES: LytTR family DNA-binding domain-containing protein [Metabacillus]MBZ5753685.1 LytTR family DNA-binding domain-containing protein [Metabacillus rhizolycopersici]MCM3652882.1 LytTR family DNA-binding domain-containing protein [Metabacillus litoralis]